MLLRYRRCFAEPCPPLTELAAAAGLERRQHQFGHDDEVWRRAAAVAREIRLTRGLGRGPAADAAVRALDLLERGGQHELREALDLLYDGAVLYAVTGELLTDGAVLAEQSLRLIAAADRPSRTAVSRWVAAVVAERAGQVLVAEAHLRVAAGAAAGWSCAHRRLADYECDRGDTDAAIGRLEAIRTPADDRTLLLARAADPSARLLGLAEAHLRRLHEFAPASMADLADLAGCDEGLAVDVLLWEDGWFTRFLHDRGPLLAGADAHLAAGWVGVERTVYEVADIGPDGEATWCDLRTGERLAVAGAWYPIGARVCARAVPVGTAHRVVGELLDLPPGRELQMHRVMDRRDGRGLLAWAAAVNGPADQLVDGDPKVHCQVVLRTDADPAAALDAHYLALDPGWAWICEDGDVIGSVFGDGNELTASTSSEARMDRLLGDLAVALPPFVVVREDRHPVRPWRPGAG